MQQYEDPYLRKFRSIYVYALSMEQCIDMSAYLHTPGVQKYPLLRARPFQPRTIGSVGYRLTPNLDVLCKI